MRIHWTVGLLPLMAGICLVLAFFSTSYLALKVFPEVGMVLKSQCSNPTPSWNGKILEFQVSEGVCGRFVRVDVVVSGVEEFF